MAKKNIPYKVILSTGPAIEIDSDELQTVISAIQEGNVAIVRKGVFNPSFYVSIVRDEQRWDEYLAEINRLSDEKRQQRISRGAEPLKSIFSHMKLDELLGAPQSDSSKQIGPGA